MIAACAFALLACADGAADDAPDTAAPGACAAPTVTLVAEWLAEDLSGDTSIGHTEPGVAMGDLDADGDLDAFIAWGGGAFVLANDGAGGLTLDRTWTADGAALPDAAAVALADLDGDGDLDAWLGRERGQPALFLTNNGDHTFAITPTTDTRVPASGSFADADGDGDLDLVVGYLLTDVDPQLVLSGEQEGVGSTVFLQEPGGWVERPLPAAQSRGLVFQPAWLDVDADGDLDLYLGHVWGAVLVPNLLLRNDGRANFEVVEGSGAQKAMNSMGVAVGDANADGLPDLYVTDVGPPTLFLSDGAGDYYDATLASGATIPASATNLSSWGTTFADLDQDGCNDLFVTFGRLARDGQAELDFAEPEGEDWVDPEEQADVWLRGDCAGGFARVTGTDLDTVLVRDRSVSVGDLDGDGIPDLVTVGKYTVRQWRVGGGCGPGIALSLAGPAGNAHGLGARVRHTVRGRETTAWMLPATTHGQNAMTLYLGLGGADRADRVVVEWPGGGVTEVTDVPPGPLEVSP